MNQEQITSLEEMLRKFVEIKGILNEQKDKLTQKIAEVDNSINEAAHAIITLRHRQEEKICEENYEKFEQTGDRDLYENAITNLQNNMAYGTIVKRGDKWDIFTRENLQKFKVEKDTGYLYHKGKYPKGNIIRDPPHILKHYL